MSLEELSGGAASRLPVPSPEEWLFFRALWRVAPFLKHLPDEKRVWVPSAIAEGRRALADDPADVDRQLCATVVGSPGRLAAASRERLTVGRALFRSVGGQSVSSPPAWSRQRIAEMEREVVRSATRVVFVNDYTRERVMAKYPADVARSRARDSTGTRRRRGAGDATLRRTASNGLYRTLLRRDSDARCVP